MNGTLTLTKHAFCSELPLGDEAGKWDDVTDGLTAARNWSDDWDGQGAKVPYDAAIDAALTAAGELRDAGVAPPDDSGPAADGGVTLGWHTRLASKNIEFEPSGRVVGYSWTSGDARAEQFLLSPTK